MMKATLHFCAHWLTTLLLTGAITSAQPTDKGPAGRSAVVGMPHHRHSGAVPATGAPVDNRRYEKLKRGINIDNWLVRNKEGILAPTQYTEADLKGIRRAGFRHVRFPIRSVLMDEQQPDKLVRRDIDSIRAVLNLMLKNGLAVVFNPVHPAREYTARMATDTAMQLAFIRFWTALATEFRSYDPERVFIEPMNDRTAEAAVFQKSGRLGCLQPAPAGGHPPGRSVSHAGHYGRKRQSGRGR